MDVEVLVVIYLKFIYKTKLGGDLYLFKIIRNINVDLSSKNACT